MKTYKTETEASCAVIAICCKLSDSCILKGCKLDVVMRPDHKFVIVLIRGNEFAFV